MIKFRSVVKRNLQDTEGPDKFYAQAVSDGRVDLDELAHFASRQSTVSKADCYAVLISLLELVVYHLEHGKIVKLGELGSFRMSVSSEGQEVADELTASAIKKAKIIFSPGTDLKEMLKTAKFSKISV